MHRQAGHVATDAFLFSLLAKAFHSGGTMALSSQNTAVARGTGEKRAAAVERRLLVCVVPAVFTEPSRWWLTAILLALAVVGQIAEADAVCLSL